MSVRGTWEIWGKRVIVRSTGREGIVEGYDQGAGRALVKFGDGSTVVVPDRDLEVRDGDDA